MTAALAYLTARSVLNRLAHRTAQLRRPRYLIAFILGLVYVWGVLGANRPAPLPETAVVARSAELLGAVMLVGVAAWSWTFGSERRALGFSPAEVTFLFPAPLTRRALIHYKLARLQLLILLNVVIWTLLLSRQQLGVAGWRRAVALWVLLSTIALHRTGAALVRRSVAEHGALAVRRRIVSLTLVAVGVAGALSGLLAALPALATLGSAGGKALLDAADALASAPLASVLLRPFRLAVAPLAAPDARTWAASLGPALLLLGLHYLWVLRSDAAFEEAAAEWSLERARRGAERTPLGRGAASPTLLALAPTGPPAVALVWKNLAAVFRRRRVRTVMSGYAGLAAGVGAASVAGVQGLAHGAAALALTWAGFAFLLGPQWVRNDLRRDLRQLDLLRSYPLRGRTVIAAEAAASAVSLTLIQFGLLSLAWFAFIGERGDTTTLAERTLLLAAAMIALPPVNYVALLLQNGAALLYPAWMSAVGDGAGGLEALGQNLLATAAFAILLALLLAPPAAAATLLVYAAGLRPAAIAAGGIVGLGLLVAEAVLLARGLGAVYDRTDVGTPGVKW